MSDTHSELEAFRQALDLQEQEDLERQQEEITKHIYESVSNRFVGTLINEANLYQIKQFLKSMLDDVEKRGIVYPKLKIRLQGNVLHIEKEGE